jgi:hypothetical protein
MEDFKYYIFHDDHNSIIMLLLLCWQEIVPLFQFISIFGVLIIRTESGYLMGKSFNLYLGER